MQSIRSSLAVELVPNMLWKVDGSRPITTSYLKERIPVSERQAEELYLILKRNNFLKDGDHLRQDPAGSRWLPALQEEFSDQPLLKIHVEFFIEALQSAYGFHETTALHFDQVLDWLLTAS